MLAKTSRIAILLVLVTALLMAFMVFAGRIAGHRIYLVNHTNCRIVVMDEHDGFGANPGETVLLKQGFVDRTPTMQIASGENVWLGGLHFSYDRLQLHNQKDIFIPESWRDASFFGTRLTYELNARGKLAIVPPASSASILPQPEGLPLELRPATALQECVRG